MQAVTTNYCYFNGVSSFHTGGATVLFDDGSVRFLTDGVNRLIPAPANTSILEAMSTIAGGEAMASEN
jgi:prepilin-type processing-associated H-X9-DG protein